MEQYLEEQSRVQQYLLGDLDSERQQLFEEQLMVDNKYFEELLAGEDELVDKYLDGSLSPGDKEKFERYFLSTPERRQKLSFARTLRTYIVATEGEAAALADTATSSTSRQRFLLPRFGLSNPVITLSMAAALLLIMVGAGWFIIKESRLENPPRQTDSANVLLVTLVSGATRGDGEIKRVILPANIETIRFQFKPSADNYQSYLAVLQTIEGREILRSDKLKMDTTASPESALHLDVSSKLLSSGDYQLKLSGNQTSGNTEEIDRFNFRVVKQ